MKDSKKSYDVAYLFYLFECYSNNADEVIKKVNKYLEDFTEEEKAHFWFLQRTTADCPYREYLGGNLSPKQKAICEKIKAKCGVDFL